MADEQPEYTLELPDVTPAQMAVIEQGATQLGMTVADLISAALEELVARKEPGNADEDQEQRGQQHRDE